MSRPTDIELQKARVIVRAMTGWKFIEIGLREGPLPDLEQYSLEEMLTAAHMIRDFGEVRNGDGTTSIMVRPDDRFIAALYCLVHFQADEQDDVEPIVAGHGKALVCVVV